MSQGLRHLSFFAYLAALWRDLWLVPLLSQRMLTDFYQRTLLGFVWVFLRAALVTVGIILVLGQIDLLSDGPVPYALVVASGMALWTGFNIGLTKGVRALLQVSRIWASRWTPKPIFVLSFNVLPICYMLVFLPLLIGFLLYYHDHVRLLDSQWFLRIPVAIFCTFLVLLFITNINMVTSVLFLVSRDIRFMMPTIRQLLFIASPVIYPASVLPPQLADVAYWVNPLFGIIGSWRWALFGETPFDLWMLVWAAALVVAATFAVLALSLKLEGILARISRI